MKKQKKKEESETVDGRKWEDVGACGFCLMSIEALQPGGLRTRHKTTLTPYGQCNQAIQARKNKKP